MYRSTAHTFSCPCGQEFTDTIYEYVNIAQEPRLRYVVLAGLLNVATCPFCGRKAALARPFVYSDPEHELLVYMHPRADAPEEARILILERLRSVYMHVSNSQMSNDEGGEAGGGRTVEMTPAQAREMPPLKVAFGLDQLIDLINTTLDPEERLGKLALSTQSRDAAERGQFLTIARKLASDMDCGVEVDDLLDEYTVWLYGSRRCIASLMRQLAI